MFQTYNPWNLIAVIMSRCPHDLNYGVTMIALKPAFQVLALSALCLSSAFAEEVKYNCQNSKVKVNIQPQPLASALDQLTLQTHCPISRDADLKGVIGKKVSGYMTPIDALVELSKDTGLEASTLRQGLGVGKYEQDKLALRAASLKHDFEKAVDKKSMTQERARRLSQKLDKIVDEAKELAMRQGFVSSAEIASYERSMADIAKSIEPVAR